MFRFRNQVRLPFQSEYRSLTLSCRMCIEWYNFNICRPWQRQQLLWTDKLKHLSVIEIFDSAPEVVKDNFANYGGKLSHGIKHAFGGAKKFVNSPWKKWWCDIFPARHTCIQWKWNLLGWHGVGITSPHIIYVQIINQLVRQRIS